MKSLLIKSAIASGVVLSLATFSRPVMAASFSISIENAGKQTADYSNLTNSRVQNFDAPALTTGYSVTGFAWADGTTNIGSYTNTLIVDKDQYGGADGKGKYFDVDTNRSGKDSTGKANNQTVSTLKLTTAQSYFGLWWSAGDANNKITFLSQGQVVQSMTTKDVVDYIAKQPNKDSYYGNPNSPTQNKNEPYAFINFYDVGGTFDQVQFSNVGGTGFESDNHTVATGYNKITGNVVIAVPESSSVLGVFVIGFVGAASVMTRQVKKKSVLQLS